MTGVASQDSAQVAEPKPFVHRAKEWLGRTLRTASRWVDQRLAPVGIVLGLLLAWLLRNVTLVHVPDYLGSVVALETTTVAIMVPVVLDVAFRVYEEYRSREVRSYLLTDPRLTWLVSTTFINALAAVLAHSAYSWVPSSGWFVPLTIFATSQVVLVVILLLRYLYELRRRVLSEPDWLIDQLTDDALRLLPERR